MTRSFASLVTVVAILITGVLATTVPAQQSTSLQTELLAEVRLLRQSIETLAGGNARVQIVFGRLQLQEQRTTAAARRLDDVRSLLSVASSRAADMAEGVKALEEAQQDTRRKPEALEALRQELAGARRELARLDAERARLQGEEADAAALLNQEQGRWSDLNRTLDELERSLVTKPR